MQCTSYVPVYHARDLNVGSSGFSWNLFISNAKYGEENGYNISLPAYNMDKEVLRQIIQNHDATFRHQVQELHRLYKKQRELMDEMRVGRVFSQSLLSQTTSESIHSLSHAQSDISHATSHATSLLLGGHSHSKLSELTAVTFQQPPKFIPSNDFQERTVLHTGPSSIRKKNSYNENRILDLELPADAYHGGERNQFRESNLSEAPELTCNAPEKLPDIRPATGSEIDSVKTRDSSSFNLKNNGKRHCFIDLNEPIQLESLPSSSKCPMETYTWHMEIMHNNPCISDSLVPKDSGFLNCDGSSDGINSSVAIDLNSMPVGCFSEADNLEHIRTVKKDTTEILDTKIDNKVLKTETDIDLNTDIVPNEPSPPSSSSTVQIKSGGDRDLEGPVSPENEECSPPRGKSEDIQPEQGKKEPFMELDSIAARTLVTISSSGAHGCLSWFAEIVSATGDDLENKITKLKNDAACNDQGEVLSVSDLGAIIALKFSEENELNLTRVVKKEREIGTLSGGSQKGHSRGTRRRKDSRTEVLPSPSKNVGEIGGFLETGSSRRKTGKKACAKPINNSRLSSDRVKNPMSKHGVLQSWGKIKKREGGLRRKASKFLVIS